MNTEMQTNLNVYDKTHPSCYSHDQLSSIVIISALGYLTLLLLFTFLFVKLVNYSNLVKYKYDLSKTLFTAIVLIVVVNLLLVLLDLKIKYSTDVCLGIISAMILLANSKS